jgi:hypothetical protein
LNSYAWEAVELVGKGNDGKYTGGMGRQRRTAGTHFRRPMVHISSDFDVMNLPVFGKFKGNVNRDYREDSEAG